MFDKLSPDLLKKAGNVISSVKDDPTKALDKFKDVIPSDILTKIKDAFKNGGASKAIETVEKLLPLDKIKDNKALSTAKDAVIKLFKASK